MSQHQQFVHQYRSPMLGDRREDSLAIEPVIPVGQADPVENVSEDVLGSSVRGLGDCKRYLCARRSPGIQRQVVAPRPDRQFGRRPEKEMQRLACAHGPATR